MVLLDDQELNRMQLLVHKLVDSDKLHGDRYIANHSICQCHSFLNNLLYNTWYHGNPFFSQVAEILYHSMN